MKIRQAKKVITAHYAFVKEYRKSTLQRAKRRFWRYLL